MNERHGDGVRGQFPDFIQSEVKLHKETFLSFLRSRDKLDQFSFHSGIKKEKYPE